MILLVDIGNTRIKWATLDDRGLGVQQAAPYAGWTAGDLTARILMPAGRAQRAMISNVGGTGIAQLIREAMDSAWAIQPEFVQATAAGGGVRNGYADPAQLGVDRWAALIGARHMSEDPLCIAGVGTAMTIDGLDGIGRHLGGWILPGPDLMVSALLRNTSDLAERSRCGEAGKGIFADNTFGAIHQGACHALAALVERSVDTMGRAVGGTPQLLLTGGASEQLEPYIHRPFRVVPDLVLRGLAVLAEQPVANH